MATIHERIEIRIAATRKSYRRASLDSGMSPEAISALLRNTSMSPTLATIEKIAVGLETTPEWIAFGIGPAAVPGSLAPAVAPIPDNEGRATTAKSLMRPEGRTTPHGMTYIQASVAVLHRFVSAALQIESIPAEQAAAYADAVLELIQERSVSNVVLRLEDAVRNVPGSPEPPSDGQS